MEDIAPLWGDETEQRWLRFFRDLGNRLANETLHPSAAAIFRQIAPPQSGQSGKIGLASGPSPDWIKQALLQAFWSFASLLGLIYDEFRLDKEEFEEAYVEGMRTLYELTDEERRNTGRNAPCPCGSGRKFKQCHLGQ